MSDDTQGREREEIAEAPIATGAGPADASSGPSKLRTRVLAREDLAIAGTYHSPQVDVPVKLNTNEAPETPPAAFMARLGGELSEIKLNRYPDRRASELCAALALHHHLEPSQVFPANGSNEVLQAILLAYGGANRRAAVFEPTYAMHSQIAKVTGTTILTGYREPDFSISDKEISRVLAKNPAVTFLCSPNNPTGLIEPRSVVIDVLRRAPGLVVLDEAYGQFSSWTAAELLASNAHLLVVRTFSKTWSLAGLRLGYALGDKEVIDALWSVCLPYHLDSIKQRAGCIALQGETEMTERVTKLRDERERVRSALLNIGIDVVKSDANFLLFATKPLEARQLWQKLLDRGVLVRDVSSFVGLDGYLRVTIGSIRENDAFLCATEEIMGGALEN